MPDFYSLMEKHKAKHRIRWKEIGDVVDKEESAIRLAFKRKSLSQLEIKELSAHFSIEHLYGKVSNGQGENFENLKGENLYNLIRQLKSNHNELIKDEIFALYCEWIHSEIEKKKAKESLRKLIDEQVKLKKG